MIRVRTHAGLTAARGQGRKGGRKPGLNERQVRDPENQVGDVATKRYGVSRMTLYRVESWVSMLGECGPVASRGVAGP
ncbi:hypothetical protein SAMN04244574_04191 [Azotobacter beijerinckii]|uniref:Helix-turn-helix domain of resolvase n=1 Tax=Azotobacter beijerinckii TaxID=170623 RepID=A0A1I4HDE1_9GAMM|nr:hypothetical protein SAMN04244574_04191 [Azotobacter beijerinckii]